MRSLLAGLLGLVLACPATAATGPNTSVLTYHGDPRRSGNYVEPSLTWQAAQAMHRDANFAGQVDGHVYAQPLYWRPQGAPTGEIIVATESNVVQALDASSGRTIWRAALGNPVPRSELPCGNINPLGITGTPVIDPRTAAVYLDAMLDRNGTPAHFVFGLSLTDGHILPGWPVNVQSALRSQGISFDPGEQNQRSALALLGNRIYLAFSGHWGDCGRYHGVVLGLDTGPPHAAVEWATSGLKGGIWAPGGISADQGALFITTGNTEGAANWADGEGVFRLGPDLAHSANPQDFFAPRNWKELDEDDLDMSGVSALPIDPGGAPRILALGKDGRAYLLNRQSLGGIGGQIAAAQVARGLIITAPAFYPDRDRVLVAFPANRPACPNGQSGQLAAIAVTASTITPDWCAPLDGHGSPIVTTTDGLSQPIVWIAGAEGDNKLHAYRGDTGAPLWTGPEPLTGLRHFVTILPAGHRLYIAGDGRVFAFTWP